MATARNESDCGYSELALQRQDCLNPDHTILREFDTLTHRPETEHFEVSETRAKAARPPKRVP